MKLELVTFILQSNFQVESSVGDLFSKQVFDSVPIQRSILGISKKNLQV